MNEKSRAVRVMLEKMAPVRSIPYIKAFQLPEEEELFIIEREARRKSITQIAREFNTSEEVVKRRRKAAFAKICDALEHDTLPTL